MKNTLPVSFLRPALFWDANPDNIDLEHHSRFIIERIINRGSYDDWKALINFYGRQRLKEEVVTIRNLNKKSLNYLSVFFNLKKNEFRCCT
jgi:hypothetical protein